VEFHNAQGVIIENFHKSARSISKVLEEKGILISHNTIYLWKKKALNDLGMVISGNEKFLEELAEQELNTTRNLLDMQDKIKEYMGEIENKISSGQFGEDEIRAYGMLNGLLSTWANRIALYMKKQGELIQKIESVQTKEITVNVNQNIQNQILDWMEKRQYIADADKGMITIYAPEIIDMFKKKKKKKAIEA